MYHDVILLGIVISILFYEWTGISPAGIVVAGYMALTLHDPKRIVYLLVVVFLTYGVVKICSNWMILYGKRKFAVMILLSFAVDWGLTASGLSPVHGLTGSIIPGIIAQEFDRQGIWVSLLSLGIVTLILAILTMVLQMPAAPVFLR